MNADAHRIRWRRHRCEGRSRDRRDRGFE